VDGDGDLDPFVGGRVIAGAVRNRQFAAVPERRGQLRLDADASREFVAVGLVSDAMFSDLTPMAGRSWSACQWGR
jgi:hypothetical protein